LASPGLRRSVWMEHAGICAEGDEHITIGNPDSQHNGVSGILRVASQLGEAIEGKMNRISHS
jgi:hypothetical protein